MCKLKGNVQIKRKCSNEKEMCRLKENEQIKRKCAN